MKRHGLWQWHRCLKQHQTGKTLEWWGKDHQRASEIVFAGFQRRPNEFSNVITIVRCAYRYMRIKRIQKTAGNYINICELIGKRAGFAWKTINASVSHVDMGTRRKAQIVFDDEFTKAETKAIWPVWILKEEIKKREKARKERELQIAIEKQKYCFVCAKNEVKKALWLNDDFYDKALDRSIPLVGGYHGLQLCWSCWMRFRKLQKPWKEAEELRLINNRYKRKIYESAKNNAGTTGSTLLHHGGCDQRGCET